MVDAVVFDWGNVLGRFDASSAFTRLAQYSKYNSSEVAGILKSTDLKDKSETGRIDERELFTQVCKHLEVNSLQFSDFQAIWGDIVFPCDGVVSVLKKIRPHIPMFVLSNTEPSHWRYIERLEVMKRFFASKESLLLSYELGHRKPSKEIFLAGMDRVGLSAHRILYIDDIQDYVEVFRSLGGRGAVYNCSLEPVSKLEEILTHHGVV